MKKLGIVIPFKSQVVSRNWDSACIHLENTLRSISSQSCKQYAAIVVGHELPSGFETEDYGVQFHQLELPPPLEGPDGFQQEDYTNDKNRKIVRGMQCLGADHEIDYWFALDADDLLQRDLVRILSGTDCKAGCLLDGGYLIYERQKRIIPHKDMSAICGSTSILSNRLFNIPDGLTYEEMQQVPWCRYSHSAMDQYFKNETDAEFIRIKDRLIGYMLGYGDNCSDGYRSKPIHKIKAWLKPYLKGKRISKSMIDDFSIIPAV